VDELIDAAPPPPEQDGAPVEILLRGPPVERERAWGLVGDTDWLNRLARSGAVRSMAVRPEPDGLTAIEGTIAGPAGMSMPYTEIWTSWAWAQHFRQVRDYTTPLLHRTDYHARLLPRGALVEPEIQLRLYVPWAIRGPVRWMQAAAIRRRWQTALDELAQPEPPPARTLPPAVSGALARWEEAVGAELVARFSRLLQRARPTTLQRLRAFSLADDWQLPRDAVLEAMLYGVEAGMLELYWSVRCTRCSGQISGESALSNLPDHADCPSCRLSTETDLGANVEALFAPHPAIMPRVEEQFCTLYPMGSPELHGVFTMGPGQRLRQTLALPPGRWRLGPGGEAADLVIESLPEGGPTELHWQPDADTAPQQVRSGSVTLHLHNDVDARQRLYLARVGTRQPQVLASYVTNHPTFRARMGHQALAPDLRLSVRAVSLMFTDLSGSTAMYEAQGDARAFALVHDHFVVLRAAVADSGGVVIKTIGDAVMAAFSSPGDAARCALRMQADFARWAATLDIETPPALKIGLHVGPALAAHSDVTGLDYFGSTVNLAARTEGCASGGEIIWTQEIHDAPEVQKILAQRALSTEPFEATLKGVSGRATLHRLTLSGNTP
jgi:class 3 adenylate cyclase